MVAYDLLGIAPDTRLIDIRISDLYGKDRISDVAKAYHWAINKFNKCGIPHILNNSWVIYNSWIDLGYAKDKNHVFTKMVERAVESGIKILFSAGNCGCSCRADRGSCFVRDKNLWGANGHPYIITVGALTIQNKYPEYLDYSSKGPAALDDEKPDFCSYSHFKGYNSCDTGTSASSPVTAGVVALLLQSNNSLLQTEIKQCLSSTAYTLVGLIL
jgi:serine protease AprX